MEQQQPPIVDVQDTTKTPATETTINIDPPDKLKDIQNKESIKTAWNDYNNFKSNLANNFTKSTTENTKDQFFYNRPASYNPESTTNINQNFERYYSHPAFKKLGFSPWRDNESLYNSESGVLGDVGRATVAGLKMVPTGFKSALRSYKDVLAGDFFAQDEESAKEMQRLNLVGMSTRGGVGGFMSNLLTSAGYTVGIGMEMAAEGTVGALLTPGTGGASDVAAAAHIGTTAVRAGKTLGKFFNVVEGYTKAVNAMKNFDFAKDVYGALRGTAKFLNPLSNTTEAIKALKGSENMVGLAKTSLVGAFHKDVLLANASLSESKLEGASASQDLRQDLNDKFFEEHGRQPNRDESLAIERQAKAAGDATLAWNFPTIFLTNKITFDPLLRRFAPMEDYITRAGTKLVENKGIGFAKPTFSTAIKGLLKPATYGKATLNYFKGNFTEGLQESLQDVIAATAKDYYRDMYNHPSKQGQDQSVGENYTPGIGTFVGKNVADQFSGKGFETFASGFFMGGLLKIQGHAVQAGKEAYNRVFDKERYAEYRKNKEEYDTKTVGALNELYKDPLKYFGSKIINFSNSANTVENQDAAAEKDNKKVWQDVDDQNVWSHISTALDTGTYNIFTDKLRAIKTMSPEAIKETFGVDSQEVQSKLDRVLNRAEILKENYETWNNRASNPFTPRAFKKDTPEYEKEVINYSAWEQAKKNAIFYGYSLARNTERIQAIQNDILKEKVFQETNASDITKLFNVSSINKELALLKTEISSLKGFVGADARKDLTAKQTKFEKLQAFRENLENYFIQQSTENLSDEEKKSYFEDFKKFKETTDIELKKSYKNYLKHVAAQNNVFYLNDVDVDNSYKAIKDLHTLNAENRNLTDTVNMLSNPKGFNDHYDRMHNMFGEMWNNKEKDLKEGLAATYSRIETNSMLNNLHRLGYVLNPSQVEKLVDTGEIPEQFYNVVNKQTVEKGDSYDYKTFEAIIKDFLSAKKGEPVTTPEAVVETPAPIVTTSVEEPAITKPVTKSIPVYNIEEKLAALKTGEDLVNFEADLMATLGSYERTVESGIDPTTAKDLIAAVAKKEQELVEGFNPENLKEGNVVVLKDNKEHKAVVSKIGKDYVIVHLIGTEQSISKTIKKDNLKKSIRFKLSDVMKEELVNKPDKKETENMKTNQDLTEEFSQDPAELKLLQDQADKEGASKVNDDFINNLGCK